MPDYEPPLRTRSRTAALDAEDSGVAFVVCQAIRLDTNTAAADYIQLYDGDKATLAESLDLIQHAAAEIIAAVSADELDI